MTTTITMKGLIVVLLLGLQGVAGSRRGLYDIFDDLGRMGSKRGGKMEKSEGMMSLPYSDNRATSTPTPRKTVSPAAAPTFAPTQAPTLNPTNARDPITPETAELVRKTFIPGASLHTLQSTEEITFFNDTFVSSGQLKTTDNGVVSLAPLADKVVFVTCDLPNRAIQVDFNVSIGTGQLPHLFPEGSVLVIKASVFGNCDISPPAVPDRINLGLSLSDAYLIIDYLIVNNDFTITLHGKSGTFFNMFSEGTLSIIKTGSQRRKLTRPVEFSKRPGLPWFKESHGPNARNEFEEMEQMLDEMDDTGHRHLAFSDSSILRTSITRISGSITIDDEGGLQELQATWDKGGLSMTADIRMEFITIIDTDITFTVGPETTSTVVQSPIATFASRFTPMVLSSFLTLKAFSLPEYLIDTFTEAPLFVAPINNESESGSFSNDEFGFGSRVRYSTGVKSFKLTANGPWDAIKTGGTLTESTPGRFTASGFTFIRNETAPFVVEDFKSLRIFAGSIPALVVYGSLFSAHFGLQVGTETIYTKADPAFPPTDPRDGLFGDCTSCPEVRIFGAARTTEPSLVGTLGYFVDPDVVGPSDKNTIKDLQFIIAVPSTDNPSETLERAMVCYNPQFGETSTEACSDVCCNGLLGEKCMDGQCLVG